MPAVPRPSSGVVFTESVRRLRPPGATEDATRGGCALDNNGLQNVAATIEILSDAERVASASGFMPFIMELIQEVFQTIATGIAPAVTDLGAEDDFDDMFMVQLSQGVVDRCRTRFADFQHALEKLDAKSKIVVETRLLFLLESRYRGICDYMLCGDLVQEVHAMLVALLDTGVIAGEYSLAEMEQEFVRRWWGQVHLTLRLSRQWKSCA